MGNIQVLYPSDEHSNQSSSEITFISLGHGNVTLMTRAY